MRPRLPMSSIERSAPPVTVVLSVYNGSEFIDEAVLSTLGQTLQDFELLAADDGSTDDTLAKLRAYEHDPRVRVVHHENMGMARSLNHATTLARGAYIAHMDHDDIMVPKRLEIQAAFLDAHPDVAVVGGAAISIGAGGTEVETLDFPLTDADIKAALAEPNVFNTAVFAHSAITMRTDALVAVGGYRPPLTLASDYDLYHRISERYAVANVGEPVVYWRQHLGQSTTVYVRRLMLSVLAAHHAARCRRETGRDPLDGVDVISERALLGMGIEQEVIDSYLDAAFRFCTEKMAEAGYPDLSAVTPMWAAAEADA